MNQQLGLQGRGLLTALSGLHVNLVQNSAPTFGHRFSFLDKMSQFPQGKLLSDLLRMQYNDGGGQL